MLNFILIANPETRRVQLFQQALERCGVPPARSISYADLLACRCDLAQFDSPDTIFRFDAPERSFEVDRGFIAAGAELEPDGRHQRISASAAVQLPADLGRIWYQRQWYLGWRQCLKTWTANLQGRILNHPDDIIIMFDKVRCQQILATAGIPVPPMLFDDRNSTITSYDRLCTLMDDRKIDRVFIKLAHGSSASGVVAYERRNGYERAITTVERVAEGGELRFYNSRLIRQYRATDAIADIVNFLASESIQVETWLPKARLAGREFDVRVVVIGGKARQAVIRVGNSPMTNLHLGNDRREIADLPPGLSPVVWEEMLATCERAAACFPNTFYCGIDLLIAPNLREHYILELNAFGDLLQGITWQGEDTYTTQVRMLLTEYLK
ncbi:STM4014 family protein [Chamaesiphon sp. VAR_48_metabat_135_sub]|uniref:STM4014 family protein n=1 Tax=Chamaesiphon sp. VAR_48_metabat_135_sub TaxID=2964699 RepID=UPI00286CD68F|nr:STM4014 family protein [Chamaesiphon sp. VAR_48_metabat_135_sub]